MANPWEKYQTTEGPWTKYKKPEEKPESPGVTQQVGRQLGLTGRALAEGAVDLAAPFANAAAIGTNLALKGLGVDYRFPENQGEQFSQALTQAGVPEPQGTVENIANFSGRLATSIAASGPVSNMVLKQMGLPTTAQTTQRATTEAGKILEREGVPLDKVQASGKYQKLRSALFDHPFTSEKQISFSKTQQKSFNRAVLRAIGSDADEATPKVMLEAKTRIGAVFNDIGKTGARFDDTLQTNFSEIIGNASKQLTESELKVINNNIDDILASAAKNNGVINGKIFIKARANLSNLSKRTEFKEVASDLEDALLDALERSYPGKQALLNAAREQYRSLKIIEPSITRDLSGNISPARLTNALYQKTNRAMTVYGQGGDQRLVELAKAGKEILPESLPQSGTIPRGMMQAPIRAIATAPIYKAAQYYDLRQPIPFEPTLRKYLIPATGATINRLTE